jgi:hypothetical protein
MSMVMIVSALLNCRAMLIVPPGTRPSPNLDSVQFLPAFPHLIDLVCGDRPLELLD